MAPSTIGRYRIVRRLGAGGMGEVFLAEDESLGRKVAIKMLAEARADDDEARRRLLNEARAAAALDHPNICAVYEVGEDAGRVFIAMQYIEGESLAERCAHHPLTPGDTVDVAIQVADALAAAHAHGIIHRDIKPQNVMLTMRGQVKVLDFGLAAFARPGADRGEDADTLTRLTRAGTIVGTPGFMSPEQLHGRPADERSDIFALGVLLYECATGTRAFDAGTPLEVSIRVVTQTLRPPSELNPGVPPDLDRIIARATAKDASARYESAAALRAELLDVQRALTTGVSPRPSTVPSDAVPVVSSSSTGAGAVSAALPGGSSWFGRHPRWLAGAAALLVVAAVWGGTALLRGGRRHAPPHEATTWYERGTANLREGAYFQASKALEQAVALDPAFALARARLVEAYAEMDLVDKAREELLQAIALVPDQAGLTGAESAYLDAVGATLRRDFPAAIATYAAVVERASGAEKAVASVDLGRAYERNDNLDRAIASYRAATELDPQSAVAYLRLGILLGRGQGLAQANEAFANAERIYRAMSNLEGVAAVAFERGAMLARTRQLPQAREQLEEALSVARTSSNQVQAIKAQLQLSSVYYAQGDAARAEAVATDAIATAQSANIRTLAANGMIDLGYTLLSRGAFEAARTYFQRALDAARQDRTARTEARARLALGSLGTQEGKLDDAIASLQAALQYFQPAGYRKETSNALILLGRAYEGQGKYDVALKAFTEQLELAKQADDPGQLAAIHSSLGVLLGIDQELYAEALVHLDETYRINASIGARVGMGWDQMNRASVLWPLGRYEEAAAALAEARTIAEGADAGFKDQLAWVELTAAQMAVSRGARADAVARANAALSLAGDTSAEATLQAKQVLALAGDRRSAVRLADEAVSAARALEQPRLISSALLVSAEAHLGARSASDALARALEAQRLCEAAGQRESAWRASLLAARAASLAGDTTAAYDHAAHAESMRASLETRWGAVHYQTYVQRPDIQAALSQLKVLLARKG